MPYKLLSGRANAVAGTNAIVIAVMAGLVAFVLRWYFVTHAQVLQPLDAEAGWGDAAEYYRYAWHLMHQGIFSSAPLATSTPRPDSFRDPAYPGYLALWMIITGDYDQWYGLVLLSQAFLGGLAVTFAILATRDVMPAWALTVASMGMATWPHLISLPAYVLSENLTGFLWAFTAFALSEAARRGSIGFAAAGGLALSLAALSNAVLVPVAIVLAMVLSWKRQMPPRHLATFLVIAMAPLIAWSVRNATLDTPTSSTFRAEINLVQGSWPTYHLASQLWGRHDPIGIQTLVAIDGEIGVLHENRMHGLELIFARMSRSPGTYLAWYLSKPMLLWGWEIGLGAGDIYIYPTRNSPFITNPLFKGIEMVAYIFNGLLALLALVGIAIVMRRPRTGAAAIVFAVTAVWVTLVYGILQSDARYSIPYRTGEIALACVTLAAAANFIRRRPTGDATRLGASEAS